MMVDIIVVGAGPAGLSAAIYAARAGMEVLVFEKVVYGGQIGYTAKVDNFPGNEGITGVDLATNLYNHAISQGASVQFEEVLEIDVQNDVKWVRTEAGKTECRAVIVAGGAKRRLLGVPGEAEFTGHGVSYCATCDGAFFKGKNVAIVGGGNSALAEALFLSNHCEKVHLVHRRDSLRAAHAEQVAVRARENIEMHLSATVERIEGVDRVESLMLNGPDGSKTLAVDGVFVAIGMMPETALIAKMVLLDEGGYVKAGEDCLASSKGLWVAGDLRVKNLRQVVTAISDGAVAAVAASEYCNKQKA